MSKKNGMNLFDIICACSKYQMYKKKMNKRTFPGLKQEAEWKNTFPGLKQEAEWKINFLVLKQEPEWKRTSWTQV